MDLALTKVAAVTGIRSMFNMTGGALSVTAMVLVLSCAPNATAGLELTFVGARRGDVTRQAAAGASAFR